MIVEIIISDHIGIKSGMDHVHRAEVKRLSGLGYSCEVLSNYSGERARFYYPNIYEGSIAKKLLSISVMYFNFLKLCLKSHKVIIRHNWYGTWIDVPFVLLACFFPRVQFYVHEIVMLDYKGGILTNVIGSLLKISRNKLIALSEKNYGLLSSLRSSSDLVELSCLAKLDRLPEFDVCHIPAEYTQFVDKHNRLDSVICLFFGDFRASKGFSEVIEMVKVDHKRLVFMVCGQDIFGLTPPDFLGAPNCLMSARRQSDDETSFLFTVADIVLLPYKVSSQSGVLEMARAYNKAIAVSPYMSDAIENYDFPSIVCDFDQGGKVLCQKISDFHETLGRKFDQKINRNYHKPTNNE
jgi:hypothetical protein